MSGAVARMGLSERTIIAGVDALAGRRHGWRAMLPFAGPAVIASIAYMDPGNFATNIQAGAGYGYSLLWVVLAANLMAMLFQSLAARLGIVTGMSLAEHCRARLSRPAAFSMWLVAELTAMATDLAEFLGAAVALSLLLHMPLMAGLALTAVFTYAMLILGSRGFRPLEVVIAGFIGIIGASYVAELAIAPPEWASFMRGATMPALPDAGAVAIAVGIVGATVMPHAIYLHSSLPQRRIPLASDADRHRVLRFSNREVIVALGIAGLINVAMVAMAASAFNSGHPEVAEIETAYHTLGPLLGGAAAFLFLLALLASGLSSSVVGTMAGQGIMQDFLGTRVPMWVRRVATMAPAFVVAAVGWDVTQSLVVSQIVLSLTLPVPMIALLILTGRRDVMGPFVAGPLTRAAAIAAATTVLGLNAVLLLQTAGIDLPFLG